MAYNPRFVDSIGFGHGRESGAVFMKWTKATSERVSAVGAKIMELPVKIMGTALASDEQWIAQQLNAIPDADEGYTDAQFLADLKRTNRPLEDRAERARQQMKQGTAKKFPR